MGLWQDLQFAGRLLVKDKWFTLVATLALAFGIGVNATVFTFVNAVLLRGLPIDDPGRVLVIGWNDAVKNLDLGMSHLDFVDFSAATQAFTSLAASTNATMNVSEEGRAPERYSGTFISGHGFSILRQAPVLGRDFLPEDDRPGAPPVVLLGHGVWKNRYGSDPSVIGRSIRVNETPAVVIGVMPEGFKFPQNADLWQPLAVLPDLQTQPRTDRRFEVFGRLVPGASHEQAQAESLAIGQRLARDYPDTIRDLRAQVMTFNERQNGGEIRAVFLSLLGAVGFVLLIACANVANLLLARASNRAREIAVRVSLGASRTRIVRQLFIESLLLAAMSGVLGLVLAVVGVRLFDVATQDVGRPYWIQFTFDGAVFTYLALICLGTAVAFGLAPALHVARTDVNEVLKEGGRSGAAGMRVRRWAGGLVIAELVLTLALLAGAGFMMRNFLTLYQLDLGFDTSRLLTMSLLLPDAKYPGVDQRLAFYQHVQERLGTNLAAVTIATNAPMQGGMARHFEIDGQRTPPGTEPPEVTMLAVDHRYFHTLGVPVLRGRAFTEADGTAGHENVIINARLAQMHFGADDPLGRRIVLSLDAAVGTPPAGIPAAHTGTIVGVVPNIRQRNTNAREPDPVAYLPFVMFPRAGMTLVARSDGNPHLLVPRLREEMRTIDADLPLYNIWTLDEALAQNRWAFRVFGSMFLIFALMALLLSSIGLYAVTAYSVTQRTQEIGVRTALGAQSTQVMWLFLRGALLQLGTGLTLGVAAAIAVGSIFEATGLLVQVDGRDPITIGSIAALLAMVSIAASVWPARRATLLDPLSALRREP
jgi:putative ABC transport system permease protein